MGRVSVFAALAALLGAAPLAAEPPPIPNLAVPEKDLGDERKFVVWHKQGVSYDEALRDITECSAHAGRLVQRKGDTFVPWGREDSGRIVTYDGGGYGLVGLAIASIIAGPLERSISQSILIRCMDPRGYTRHRANEEQWKDLFEKGENGLEIYAAIASGPVPPTPVANP